MAPVFRGHFLLRFVLAGGPGLPIPMSRNRGETLRLRSGQAMGHPGALL